MNKKEIGWHFDNSYVRLPEIMFSKQKPALVKAPQLVLLNGALAESLGLDFTMLSEKEKAELFSGNSLPIGADPIAQAYAGHQFGYFTLLGDGRAIVLGEHLAPDNQRVDLQLKGSGRTPYSRQGDGLAALGPMLREYLISEAMHALGIPTTRSLAVVTTGENVIRKTVLPGAVLTRVAASHIRVGTFEYIAMQNDKQLLKTLVTYTIERHYPALKVAKNPTLELLQAVMERQITLMIHWMRVGFIHGVMNTDNMAISGESIDYGPCAFMNAYDLKTVFSSIDYHGRYAFGNQPKIAQWNLTRFAETLLPLFHENQEEAIQMATDVLNCFAPLYHDQWLNMMRKKLGIFGEESEDEGLINDLLHWMQKNQMDYTNTFQLLQSSLLSDESIFQDEFADKTFQIWHQRWLARLSRHAQPLKSSVEQMQLMNPLVIPRNHKVEEVLKAASLEQNLEPFLRLLEILSTPYKNSHPDISRYQMPPEAGDEDYRTFCGT
jgi:uncharacterized protein YdiU (UPF0061 family)